MTKEELWEEVQKASPAAETTSTDAIALIEQELEPVEPAIMLDEATADVTAIPEVEVMAEVETAQHVEATSVEIIEVIAPQVDEPVAPLNVETAEVIEVEATEMANVEAPKKLKKFDFNKIPPLNPDGFPNRSSRGSNSVPTTIPNVEFLIKCYAILIAYNVITKKLQIRFPGMTTTIDNAEENAINYIDSLAILNNMSTGKIPGFIATIADRNPINPVVDWVMSKEWDGIDRLPEYYATLITKDDYPVALKETLMRCWLLSAVAAAFKPSGFRARGVLTIQGIQGLGKSTWVKSLIGVQPLCDQVIKIDHHLDTHNKDSVLTAISHLIVELGEIEGCLKKDISKLKGFLTSDFDKIRRPYARSISELPRRTVFVATVNDAAFLVDSTGNTRFWTIPVTSVDYQHNIDTQQLWAQLKVEFDNGAEWWLGKDDEELLESFNNANHLVVSVIHERVMEEFDASRVGTPGLKALSASQILMRIGISSPTDKQAKACATTLRLLLGESKRIRGINTWRFPFKVNTLFLDDDQY